MLFKIIIYITLYTLTQTLIFSQNLEYIPLDSHIYEKDDYKYIENGEVPNFFSRPYSYNQSIEAKLNKGHYLDPILDISIRGQNINNDIPVELEGYWYNNWIKKQPLLNLGFSTGTDYFTIFTQFDIRIEYFEGFNEDTYVNFPDGENWYQDFDFNFPTRGYLSFGTKYLQLFLGRDKIKFGPGQKTNLMISGETSFFNKLNLSYQNNSFKGSFFFIPLESYLTGKEKDEISLLNDSDLIPNGNYGKNINEQSKYLSGHRFEFRPTRNLLISFTDMLLVGGRFSNFEDIPPTMFYHNVYGENYSNVMIGFDFFWTVVKGLGIYGEFIIDDIKNSFEKHSFKYKEIIIRHTCQPILLSFCFTKEPQPE